MAPPPEPGWLSVYECGHTRPVGRVVRIKEKYYTKQHNVADGSQGSCYLTHGHFNLYDQYGNAKEQDFRVGHDYRVMRIDPVPGFTGAENAWLMDVTVPPHVQVPEGL